MRKEIKERVELVVLGIGFGVVAFCDFFFIWVLFII